MQSLLQLLYHNLVITKQKNAKKTHRRINAMPAMLYMAKK
jgi:hypothetical protein